MKYFILTLLGLVFLLPTITIAGDGVPGITSITTDIDDRQQAAYYDLRDRSTYIQITNAGIATTTIHIQIFQHDRNCDELDIFDTLTPNDTIIYDLDNIIKNDGSPAPINLADDSYGYVVITAGTAFGERNLIGNFRIVDDSGYEYRTNTIGVQGYIASGNITPLDIDYYANFNTVDGANQADIIGFAFDRTSSPDNQTVINIDTGLSFDIFVYDMSEEPLSCDNRNFACGAVMNYGINEDYPASRGNDLLCPGGGLANPDGGYILFDSSGFGFSLDCIDNPDDLFCAVFGGSDVFIGLIGINNGNGTASMDTWQFLSKNDTLMIDFD